MIQILMQGRGDPPGVMPVIGLWVTEPMPCWLRAFIRKRYTYIPNNTVENGHAVHDVLHYPFIKSNMVYPLFMAVY